MRSQPWVLLGSVIRRHIDKGDHRVTGTRTSQFHLAGVLLPPFIVHLSSATARGRAL